MNPQEFKRLVAECRAEFEVRRVVHWHFATVSGTHAELLDCLRFADERAEQFTADIAPGEKFSTSIAA